MPENISSQETFGKYKAKMFTEKGYDILKNVLYNLTNFYMNKKEDEYPFKMGQLFGVPYFIWAHQIENKDELFGRIKILAQLTGIIALDIKVGDSKIRYNFDEVVKKGG